MALELKPEVKAPAAVQRRWHHRRFLEFGKKAWGRESWFFPFFFFTLWMLIPDKTVISKIGFVDFSKVFNFSSPEPNGQRRPAAFLCGPRRHSAFAGSPKSVDKCNHHSRLHERCAQSAHSFRTCIRESIGVALSVESYCSIKQGLSGKLWVARACPNFAVFVFSSEADDRPSSARSGWTLY